ncbi:AcrR family transcriptional regulator [Brevundimonas sp. 1080]|uniref:hypothetical protein n=1 Tax=Brevundimonas sp. 1080 TaxID=3156405 RepID=UPI00339B4781
MCVPKFATRRYPGLTLLEAADRADEDGGERIAPTTVNTYFQNLAAVFNWAVGEELVDRNLPIIRPAFRDLTA